MTSINSRYFPSLNTQSTGQTGTSCNSGNSSSLMGLNASSLGNMGSSNLGGLGGAGGQFEQAIASAFAQALVNVITHNPEIASSLMQALGGPNEAATSTGGSGDGTGNMNSAGGDDGSSQNVNYAGGGGSTGSTTSPPSYGASSSGGSDDSTSGAGGDDTSTGSTGSTGALGTDSTGGSDMKTKDGYTVDQCVKDMMKLQSQNKMDGGGPQRSAAQLMPIAKGIIKGINDNFGNQPGAKMAHALIASAWSESRFNTAATNGGVFQCAQNRLDDYNKAHGTNITEAQMSVASGGDASLSCKVALWAMAHPSTQGLKTNVGGVAMPSDAPNKALFLWNYNPAEISKYMKTTGYSQSLLSGTT